MKFVAACALIACASGPLNAQTAVTTGTGSVRSGEPVTLNFANADIEAVARTMATITGRNVVVDPRVKGQLTLVTEKAVSPAAAFDQFLAALRLQGFTVVEAAGLYKVVPEADAKLQAGTVSVTQGSSGRAPSGGQIVTQIFKLNFENAANLVPVLRPLISPNNTINVNPGNNSLVITDYADNLQRIARIIAAMDVSNASDVEIIPLQNAVASELAPLVSRLIEGSGSAAPTAGVAQGTPVAGGSDTGFRTTLLAEPRSNSLIVRAANPARLALGALAGRQAGPAGRARLQRIARQHPRGLSEERRRHQARGHAARGAGGDADRHGHGWRRHLGRLHRHQQQQRQRRGRHVAGGRAFGGGMNGGAGSSMGMGGGNSGGGLGSTAGSLNSANSNQPSTAGRSSRPEHQLAHHLGARAALFRQLRAVIDQLDGRRAQVLVESLIVEVAANKVAQFGIQWQTVAGNYGNGTIACWAPTPPRAARQHPEPGAGSGQRLVPAAWPAPWPAATPRPATA